MATYVGSRRPELLSILIYRVQRSEQDSDALHKRITNTNMDAKDAKDSTFQCSPALHRRPGETCLPPSALEKMRRVWNRLHPKDRIERPRTAGTRTRKARRGSAAGSPPSESGLWHQLRGAMKKHYQCETEYCLLEKMPGVDAETKKSMTGYFRPAKPDAWDKKATTWLDSFNIEDVMNQYEDAIPTFEFIGPVPIDFDAKDPAAWGQCIVDELCKLDLRAAAKKGTQQIGIIFNLDPHDQPGSHWVCAFADIPKKAAYYFDSYGIAPPKEVEALLRRFRDQGCEDIFYNDIRHQRKGSECGMYCLFVIICLLRGRSFYNICKSIVDDDTMNSFRDILFATEVPRKEAIEKALPRLCV